MNNNAMNLEGIESMDAPIEAMQVDTAQLEMIINEELAKLEAALAAETPDRMAA